MKLKGIVTVETFDAKTGKLLEKVQDHNILTKAVASVMDGCPYGLDRETWTRTGKTAGQDWASVFETLLGGILVFPTTQTANADNWLPPMDETNYPVGYASMLGQDTSDAKTGTFNAVESRKITNGYKWVYDFGTSQANGTWNCVGLTSNKGGYNFIEGSRWNDTTLWRVPSTSKDYVLGVTESHIYVGTWGQNIYRFEAHPFKIDLFKNDIFGADAEDTGIVFDGYIYIDYDNNELIKISGTSELTISTYDLSDPTASPTVTTLELSTAIPEVNARNCCFVEMGGYWYISGGTGTTVYKVNPSNGADVTTITVPAYSAPNNGRWLGKMEHGIHAVNCIIASDDSVIVTEPIGYEYTGNRIIHQWGAWFLWGRSSNDSGRYDLSASIFTPYLGTVFNLQNTVTKDASKTAKITYELIKVTNNS